MVELVAKRIALGLLGAHLNVRVVGLHQRARLAPPPVNGRATEEVEVLQERWALAQHWASVRAQRAGARVEDSPRGVLKSESLFLRGGVRAEPWQDVHSVQVGLRRRGLRASREVVSFCRKVEAGIRLVGDVLRARRRGLGNLDDLEVSGMRAVLPGAGRLLGARDGGGQLGRRRTRHERGGLARRGPEGGWRQDWAAFGGSRERRRKRRRRRRTLLEGALRLWARGELGRDGLIPAACGRRGR